MRRMGLILMAATLAGCAWFREPPEQGITTGATVVYTGSKGTELFSVCDRGNLVYLTRTNPQVFVVRDGCNPDLGKPGAPSPLAVAALTERTPGLPQPFLVQLVPGPQPEPKISTGPPEPREIVVRVEPPPPCPVCPAGVAAPTTAAPSVWPVDPNTASLDALERLPGVTAKLAQAIVRGRPYRTLEALVAKKVLTDADLQALTPFLLIR